ncbi:MAG: ABC transporter ATP-binding protein [Flavobacteriaceae bacterium]|nr:ABC transporter ATP-binding protein [Flavobacteriaceae bacterium]
MKALRYLNKYFYKYRKMLMVGIILTIVARVFSLQVPRMVGNSLTQVELYLTNSKDATGNIQQILLINILIILAAALLSGLFTFWMRQCIINVSRYIEFDLKNEIFSHYLRLTQRFFKNNRTGDLMNRVSEDVSKVRMYFGPALMYSINTITLFVVIIAYMFSVAPQLSAYTIIPFPILSILIYKLSRRINIKSTRVQEMLSKMSTFSQESFNGISVIKSYRIEKRMEKSFDIMTRLNYQKSMDLAKIQAWFFPLMILLIGCSNLIVIFIGGKKYIDGSIDIGILAEFIIYVNMLTWPVALVGWITSIVQQSEASQQRINEFLKESPEIQNGVENLKAQTPDIKFHQVSVRYPETQVKALNLVSLEIPYGQTIGIIGKVGSGKTTLLNLIPRLYDSDKGLIKIDQINIKEFDLKSLRNAIGYVPQQSFLFSETIEDNIRFGKNEATFNEIQQAATNASVHHNIIAFKNGYKTLLGERGVTLSGGQVQRISIARALLKNPKILLLDDCLSAVDSETEKTILNNLRELRKNKTTIIVSHRISSIEDADVIVVLEKGNIIEYGNHQQLFSDKKYYYELYRKQNS